MPLLDRVKGGGEVPNFLDRLIFVSKHYIPNLRPLGPFLHVEKFVVGGGGWLVVVVGVKSEF